MSCCNGGHKKTRITLEYPVKYTNFVSYGTHCKHLDVLAYHDFAEIVFPSIITGTNLQISVLDCTTNTLVYDINRKPVLATMVEPNRPYSIYFCPIAGGYVLAGFTCPTTTLEEMSVVESKGVSKK